MNSAIALVTSGQTAFASCCCLWTKPPDAPVRCPGKPEPVWERLQAGCFAKRESAGLTRVHEHALSVVAYRY